MISTVNSVHVAITSGPEIAASAFTVMPNREMTAALNAMAVVTGSRTSNARRTLRNASSSQRNTATSARYDICSRFAVSEVTASVPTTASPDGVTTTPGGACRSRTMLADELLALVERDGPDGEEDLRAGARRR